MAVIGLDLDGVVYDFTRTFNRWVVEQYPELAEVVGCLDTEAAVWNWFESWPDWSRDRFVIEMERAVAAKRLFWNATLYEADIPSQVQRLRDAGHTIEVVTHRFTPGASDATWDVLMRDKIYPCGVTFAKDKTSVKCDYFLEDNFQNFISLYSVGVNAFLINRPYNQDPDDIWGFARVNKFSEFVDQVLEMEATK